jgi:hypothetical protein
MKTKNPRTDKTVFEFKVNKEESVIYEIDYNALVRITNEVFDWDYIDEVIREIDRNEPTEDRTVEYYTWFFLEQIKDAKNKFGGFTFDETNLQRRLEIKAHLDMYAKKLS